MRSHLHFDAMRRCLPTILSYTEQVLEEIGRELARAAKYKAGFFSPAFTRLMVDALRSSGRIRLIMARLVAGTQTYRTLKWQLARTCEMGLLWRWLSGIG